MPYFLQISPTKTGETAGSIHWVWTVVQPMSRIRAKANSTSDSVVRTGLKLET